MARLRSVLLLFGAVSASSAAAEPKFQVVNLHVDLPYQLGFHGKPLREGTGQAALGKLRSGGVSGVVLPLFVPHDVSPTGPRKVDVEESYLRVLGELRGRWARAARLWRQLERENLAVVRGRRAAGRRARVVGCLGGARRAHRRARAHAAQRACQLVR